MSIEEITDDDLAGSKKTDTKWNSSTFCGTVSQFVEQRPNNVGQLPKKVELVLYADLRSTNCGTEGQHRAVIIFFLLYNQAKISINSLQS